MGGEYTGKTALIIGGSGGIGRALALELADRGANLVIHGGNSQERLENTLAELRERGRGVVSGVLCPLGDDRSPEKGIEFILSKAGGVPDMLICSWGPFEKAPLGETSPKMWRSLTENNLIFPGILISRVLHDMIIKGWGRILLFGGTRTGEIRGFTTTAAYSAAKTALGVLAKSAAKTAIAAGAAEVTCNVICPGLTDTEYTGEIERAYNKNHSPDGRALETWEIALGAMKILENPAINGAILPIDRDRGFDKTIDKG
jgi:3-oxoacyl-[acyl-carrier protein] reductase